MTTSDIPDGSNDRQEIRHRDVVVGVDESETARRAAERAAQVAAAMQVGLHLVTSIDGLVLRASPLAAPLAPVEAIAMAGHDPVAEAQRHIAELGRSLPHDDITITSGHGSPAELMCSVAAEHDAGTIVVGNRHVQGAGRVLGSVATAVLRRANVDVLVVGSTTSTAPAGDAIVVGVDRSDTARVAARRAAEWAAALDAELRVVMCVERSSTVDVRVGGDRFHTDWLGDAEQYLRDLVRTLGHDRVTTTVADGRPSRSLCDAAAEHGAGTIVVGNRRVQGASRVLGSVAGDVLRHAPCDVLVVNSVRG
ncbi:MAG TPA: universal stress protein [Ilumatobacter sp.]|nr:universal stress protein [Ilumatobacter sp.]